VPKQECGFTALMYHEICPVDDIPQRGRSIDVHQHYHDTLPQALFLGVDEFARQMRWLADCEYHCLSLMEIKRFYLHDEPLPERSVLLTFDDLYQSVMDLAYPVLADLEMKAAGFVVGDWIYPEARSRSHEFSRTLSWPELRDMAGVFEYANHSAALHTRDESGTALELAARETVLNDTRRAGTYVDHPDVYAYPFGVIGDQCSQWLAESGISLAFTTCPGYNSLKTDPLKLHRNPILCDTSFDDFRSQLSHEGEEQT
jgi:peptidoglycan/xylan/chitin deacetylase (PgdA/CDA1 family)